jgi:spore coat protein CotH
VCWLGPLLVWTLCVSPAGAQTTEDLFNGTRVHDVHLRVNAADWAALKDRSDFDTYFPADVVWNGITVRNVGIRHRGFGSRSSSKPNLRVDFNRYLTNQEFLGLKALVLDNVYSDASMLRDAVAMKVFARMGVAAPRQAHARLFVNGQFAGVYVLVEPIDRTFITGAFGASEGAAEAGGHLYEYRWIDEYLFGYLGPSLATYAEMFKAQTRETDAMVNLYRPLEELIRTVNAEPASRFVEAVGALMDLPALTTYLATETCIGERDGFVGYDGTNNFYLYRFRDGRPAVLIPWDADHAFAFEETSATPRFETYVFARGIMASPVLRTLYWTRLAECAAFTAQPAAGDPRGWLEREIARLTALITPYVPADTGALFHFDEFEEETVALLELARTRPAYLLCEANRALAPVQTGGACTPPPTITTQGLGRFTRAEAQR